MTKRSEIWKHFSLVSKGKAKCGHCQKLISFSGGATSNLARHIRLQHNGVSTDRPRQTSRTSDTKLDIKTSVKRKEIEKRSKVWKHYSIMSNGWAECGYCQKRLRVLGGRIGNLGRHIRTQHKDISLDCFESTSVPHHEFIDIFELPESKHTPNDNDALNRNNMLKRSASLDMPKRTQNLDIPKRSEIWKYFSVVSKGKAECSYCQKRISFSVGAIDNLDRHIRRQHNTISSDCPSLSSVPPYEFVNVQDSWDSKGVQNKEIIDGNDTAKRSKIWKHFSIVSNGRAECRYCQKHLSFSRGATVNLERHIRLKHKGISKEPTRPPFEMSSVPETSYSSDGSSNNDANSILDNPLSPVATSRLTYPLKQMQLSSYECKTTATSCSKKIDEQLTKTIVKQYFPLKMIEDPNFKEFIHMLCPHYTMPTRRTLSHSLIPNMFNVVKRKVKNILCDVEAVCLTMDEWTSNTQESYVAITSHFLNTVDSKTALQSYLLGCIPYSNNQSSENLGALLRTEVESWNLEEKVVCVVTNSAPGIEAVRYNNWKFLPCVANTLNGVLGDGLKIIEREIAKIRNIVSYFISSSKATNLLNTMQKQLNLPEIRLKQDFVTRWNTTYEMFSRVVRLKDAVVAVLAINKPELNCITEREWKLLEDAAEVFKIFGVVAKEISDEKHVSLSKIILIVNAIRTHLIKIGRKSTYDKITSIVATLQNSISQLLKDTESNELVTMATILDPRFKRYGFTSHTHFEQCLVKFKEKVESITPSTTLENILQTQSDLSLISEDFGISVENVKAETSNCPASSNEVDKYLSEPLIKRTEDPLKWWNNRKHIYPRLYRLIHHIFCIVVTSVPCDKVFSTAGLAMDERRSGLKPEKIAQCSFLNYNL